MKQIAWEFLRRNPAYQAAHPHAEFLLQQGYDDDSDLKYLALCKTYGLAHNMPDPAKNYDEFSILELSFVKTGSTPYLSKNIEATTYVGMKPNSYNEVIIKFDLELPLQKQLDNAKMVLERRTRYLKKQDRVQPFNKRATSTDKYAFYLRTLDAGQADVSLSDTAVVLLPDTPNSYPDKQAEKRLRASLKAAKIIRDLDYIYLPLMAT